jgi:hypothetical protein
MRVPVSALRALQMLDARYWIKVHLRVQLVHNQFIRSTREQVEAEASL